jgi:hypothetical protein
MGKKKKKIFNNDIEGTVISDTKKSKQIIQFF